MKKYLAGAVIGDVVGSRFEQNNYRKTDFELLIKNQSSFTDDTVCTVAIADWLLNDRKEDLSIVMKRWCLKYPNVGYGSAFRNWMYSKTSNPYNSYGNGSAMRVSPVAYAAKTIEEALFLAEESAKITHNHPEGIRGAKAIAYAIFMAKNKIEKRVFKKEMQKIFKYDLNCSLEKVRHAYEFDATCQKTVPESLILFFRSESFEDGLRNAIARGGDSDTIAAIVCSVSEAYYGLDGVEQLAKTINDCANTITKRNLNLNTATCNTKFLILFLDKL